MTYESKSLFFETKEVLITGGLDIIDLGEDLYVFRQYFSPHFASKMDPFRICATKTLIEGFCNGRAIYDFENGKATSLNRMSNLGITSLRTIDRIAEFGFTGGLEARTEEETERDDTNTRLPYSYFLNDPNASLDHIVDLKWESHTIFNRHGQPLPVAQCFEYISGGMHDGYFDLNHVVRVLKPNAQVQMKDPSGRAGSHFLERSDWGPVAIPHYNRSEDKSMQLAVWFQPTFEQMQEIYKACTRKRADTFYSSKICNAIMELDMMELFHHGANRVPFKDMYFG